jgi:hypothetical protein
MNYSFRTPGADLKESELQTAASEYTITSETIENLNDVPGRPSPAPTTSAVIGSRVVILVGQYKSFIGSVFAVVDGGRSVQVITDFGDRVWLLATEIRPCE